MDLPTHFCFGLAIGLVFFGHQPEIALVISLGALLPDLDREYWYMPARDYAEEQWHRAFLHNVVFIALTYAVSPFLSLGVFLHVLQDSFTTVKDRGVEWFFPFTRWPKRGRIGPHGEDRPLDPNEHVYFYQEDPPELVKLADPDLQEPPNRPVPWRRVYGFALNSHLLDRGFLVGSIATILVWTLVPSPTMTLSNLNVLRQTPQNVVGVWLVGLLGIGILFVAGEADRQVKTHPIFGRLKPIKWPILVGGLASLGAWIYLYLDSIRSNLYAAVSQPLQILAMTALIPFIAFLLVRKQSKGGREPAIV